MKITTHAQEISIYVDLTFYPKAKIDLEDAMISQETQQNEILYNRSMIIKSVSIVLTFDSLT